MGREREIGMKGKIEREGERVDEGRRGRGRVREGEREREEKRDN